MNALVIIILRWKKFVQSKPKGIFVQFLIYMSYDKMRIQMPPF